MQGIVFVVRCERIRQQGTYRQREKLNWKQTMLWQEILLKGDKPDYRWISCPNFNVTVGPKFRIRNFRSPLDLITNYAAFKWQLQVLVKCSAFLWHFMCIDLIRGIKNRNIDDGEKSTISLKLKIKWSTHRTFCLLFKLRNLIFKNKWARARIHSNRNLFYFA